MTQEDKQLLLQDLSGRLLYKVHCRVFKLNGDIKENDDVLYGIAGDNVMTLKSDKDECLMYYQIKSYLRPMSSMTEEDRGEFRILGGVMSYSPQHNTWAISAFSPEAYDWLNKKMFDYRGLIDKGLALEATEGMYN